METLHYFLQDFEHKEKPNPNRVGLSQKKALFRRLMASL